LIFITAERFCYWQTAGFRVHKIVSHHDFGTPVKPCPFMNIFDQPLSFLGSGVQFYAFESSDGQYVVKFVKHNRHRPDTIFGLKKEAQKRRIDAILSSCHIAATTLSKETGVVYAHLNQTPTWNTTALLKDKIGIVHPVPLGQTEFVIQKKAIPCKTYFDTHSFDLATAQVLELIQTRANHNIAQLDDHFERNIGFIDGKAIDIDVGSFQAGKDSSAQEKDLLRKWIKKEYPHEMD